MSDDCDQFATSNSDPGLRKAKFHECDCDSTSGSALALESAVDCTTPSAQPPLCPADHRTLDRGRQPGVDPVAGEEQARDGGPRARARAADRAPARTSPASRARRSRESAMRRARRGSDASTSRAASADSVARWSARRVGRRRSTTSDRCDAPRRRRRRLSNTHCIVRPGRPTKLRPSPAGRTRDSPSRSASPPSPAAADERSSAARRAARRRRVARAPNHGTAATTAPAVSRSPRTSTPSTRPPPTDARQR